MNDRPHHPHLPPPPPHPVRPAPLRGAAAGHPASHHALPHHVPAAALPPPLPSVAPGSAFTALIPELQRAVADEGYTVPTPIQEKAIPPLVAGRDILGCAQTGTGKTAAFTLPILQYLTQHPKPAARGRPRVLVLAPTRELAAQIGDSVRTYGKHLRVSHTVIFGGVGQQPQVNALTRGVDIAIATPGRLLDLMHQGFVKLDSIEVFVLDEADRMLDMGFINDIRKVIAVLPKKRHSMFFSATMPNEAAELSRSMLDNPVHISITPEQPTVERIKQKLLFIDKENKDTMLAMLLQDPAVDRVIVFTRTKHGADKVVRKLESAGIPAAAIHGNKSQNNRTAALGGFKSGKIRAMVATDIAARGIDVDGITHVINYDLPNEPETYVHRIGRTARAGAEGDAVSFCAADERDFLRDIERLIRRAIPVDTTHKFHSETARNATGAAARPPPKQQFQRSPRRDAGPRGQGPARTASSGSRPASSYGSRPAASQGSRPAPRPAAPYGGPRATSSDGGHTYSYRHKGR
jgi:ATP-dependent RNA helicase RhlE